MSRYPGWHTFTTQTPAKPYRRAARYGNQWGQRRSQQTVNGWYFVFYGNLPRVSNKYIHPYAVWTLTKHARELFGQPPPMHQDRRAIVQVTRVLGPGQKKLDRDKISLSCAGLIDALVPSYLKDDSETWADISYTNDDRRRQEGPAIEITITYSETPNAAI